MEPDVNIKFFPPNSICCLQPLDQGIIKSFKYHYRTFFIEKLLSLIESEQDTECAYRMVKDIRILDSLYWIKTTWAQVSVNTIINCFKHAGFNQDYVINITDVHNECSTHTIIPIKNLGMGRVLGIIPQPTTRPINPIKFGYHN